MQKEGQNKLYHLLEDAIPKSTLVTKNKAKSWRYGYDEKHDVVVISKSGQIEDVISINGLRIALPKPPKKYIKEAVKKLNSIGKGLNTLKNYLELKVYLIGIVHQLLLKINGWIILKLSSIEEKKGFGFIQME